VKTLIVLTLVLWFSVVVRAQIVKHTDV